MSERKKGSTGVSLLFRLTDATTGAAKSGIDVTTLKLQYERPGAAASTATSLTLLAALTTAHTDYGAKEVDATNSKGIYRVDCPDAGFATGADEVTWTVTGTGIEPSTRLIDLTSFDSRDVNGNLQGLTGTTAPAAGALITVGSAAGQLNVASGKAPATLAAGDVTGDVPANVLQINGSALAAKIAGLLYGSAVADGTVNTVTDSGHFTLTSTDDTLSASDNTYNNLLLVFTSGPNQFVPREITAYTGATKAVAFTGSGFKGAFPNTVTAGDAFLILSGGP